MKLQILLALLLCLANCPVTNAEDPPAASNADDKLQQQISRLVSRLNDDRAAERDAAEKQLLELAGSTSSRADRFLEALPKDSDQLPLAVRDRLSGIRKQVEDRAAKAATAGTAVTLSAKGMSLADVFKAIEGQTGNKLLDNRQEEAGPGAPGAKITAEIYNEPFWPALDQVLDQAKLGVYSYGGEEALSIVARSPDDAPRHGTAVYEGPFRLEILEVQAQRNQRQPKQQGLKLQLEVAWEPRLRPIALSQPMADVAATTDTGAKLAAGQAEATLDVEVPTGTQAAEIVLPFDLPGRDVQKIASLHGKLHALVPGRQAKFSFGDLTKSAGKVQRQGGVKITLDDVRKNGEIWEIHMQFALDEAKGSLQSHRNWVFQNLSYLVDKDGKRIENAGFEATRQTPNEVGIAYLFDVPDGLDGLTWVYESPAAIVDLPIEYEIKDIELP